MALRYILIRIAKLKYFLASQFDCSYLGFSVYKVGIEDAKSSGLTVLVCVDHYCDFFAQIDKIVVNNNI